MHFCNNFCVVSVEIRKQYLKLTRIKIMNESLKKQMNEKKEKYQNHKKARLEGRKI